jgi:ribosomal protein S18 acetylase RimI-like enzyme
VADHDWIASVAADVYGALGDYGAIIRSWLDHSGVLTYLEEVDGSSDTAVRRGFTLLGFYEPVGPPGRPSIADLLAIAVDRAHQRQGVGRLLLEHAIQLAAMAGRSAGVIEIRLTVAETNAVAQRFFAASGFAVLDEQHGHYDGGQRAIRMGRGLP